MRKIASLLAAALVLLTGCGGGGADPDRAQESLQIFAMDTVMIFRVYGEHSTRTAYAAEEEIRRLEGLLSRTAEKSPVSALNETGAADLPAEVIALLESAMDYSRRTEGAFDMTVAPLVSAWGFTEEENRVPGEEEIRALLPLVGAEHVHVSGSSVRLDPGCRVDLGGIAKGYASDRMADLFTENEIPRATASLGGNVLVWGDRPDETPWRIAVDHPEHPGQDPYAAILSLEDAYAVTSGGYQRFFEQDGQVYSHILDPKTGRPAQSDLVSVTVVSPRDPDRTSGAPGRGTMCDALSTALYVLGEERALDFWRESGLPFDLVLITEDNRVVVTAGLADRVTQVEGNGYRYETVS